MHEQSLHTVYVRGLPSTVFLEFENPYAAEPRKTFLTLGTDTIFHVDRRWNTFTLEFEISEYVHNNPRLRDKKLAGFSYRPPTSIEYRFVRMYNTDN